MDHGVSVITGGPGTGKTTLARLVGKIYKELGILTHGEMTETDRSGLVAGYVGQTAIKTGEAIQKAMGVEMGRLASKALQPVRSHC